MAMGIAKPRVWPEDSATRNWLREQKAKQRQSKKRDGEPAKPGSLKRVVVWLRQRWCSHAGYLENMQRRQSDDMVTCPCNKCGKLLVATYGLALPMQWERKPDNAALCRDSGNSR